MYDKQHVCNSIDFSLKCVPLRPIGLGPTAFWANITLVRTWLVRRREVLLLAPFRCSSSLDGGGVAQDDDIISMEQVPVLE